MTTVAQQALADFEAGWLTLNWTLLTESEKTAHIHTHYGLRIDAAKEIEANRIESETLESQILAERRQLLIDRLTELGYICDNSLTDWQKLYNYPAIYGSNWNNQAVYQHSISPDLDYFLAIAQGSYIFSPYQIGVLYFVGDTFMYNNELYKVIQQHTSQADWIPSETPALYIKVVAEGVIPEWIQPLGSEDAYMIGDKVTHNGFTWESTVDYNVWEPGVYGWTQL